MPLFDDFTVVAEIGVNHEGSFVVAHRLMDKARKAGAGAVKFQIGAVGAGPERSGGRFSIPAVEFRNLRDHAMSLGFPIFASALSIEAVRVCDILFNVIKIASRDCNDHDLIRAVAKTGKQTIISTGMSTYDEVVKTVRVYMDARASNLYPIILHCVSEYPTPIENANIGRMRVLRARTGMKVGYSNHCIGPEACYTAIAYGAQVIEVHFTDDKTREFRDHQLSFDYDDLKDFVKVAHRMRAAI